MRLYAVTLGAERPQNVIDSDPSRHEQVMSPDLDVIGWAFKSQDSMTFMSLLSLRAKSGRDGAWDAMVSHPVNGIEKWTDRQGRTMAGTPVRVVLLEKYEKDVKTLEDRLATLEARLTALESK